MSCKFVCLRFEGANIEKALNGQCSQDISNLNTATSKLIAFCNPNGRMFGSGRLLRDDDAWLLITPASQAQTLKMKLSPFMKLARVQIETDVRAVSLTTTPMEVGMVKHTSLIRLGEHGDTSWIIGGNEKKDLIAHRQRIEAGLHFITANTQDCLIPQQAHYQMLGGVSFTKGCYTGQEVIARLEHLGQSKQWLWIHRKNLVPAASNIVLENGKIAKCIETVITNNTQTSLVLAARDSRSPQLIHVPFEITRQVTGQRPIKLR